MLFIVVIANISQTAADLLVLLCLLCHWL